MEQRLKRLRRKKISYTIVTRKNYFIGINDFKLNFDLKVTCKEIISCIKKAIQSVYEKVSRVFKNKFGSKLICEFFGQEYYIHMSNLGEKCYWKGETYFKNMNWMKDCQNVVKKISKLIDVREKGDIWTSKKSNRNKCISWIPLKRTCAGFST